MKYVKEFLKWFVAAVVVLLLMYDTHTDLIIDCEKVHAECKLIAVPVNGGK